MYRRPIETEMFMLKLLLLLFSFLELYSESLQYFYSTVYIHIVYCMKIEFRIDVSANKMFQINSSITAISTEKLFSCIMVILWTIRIQ